MKTDRLTDLIAELSTNRTDEDRERSRVRLQLQYQACDTRLSDLVRQNRSSISNSVELCGKVISTVAESKSRCRNLKERISSCMNILQCNRENIRRMWLESLQHKYAHRILNEIEELRKIPREVNESLINKKLEHATEVIVSSIKFLDGNLCSADALKELKLELINLQEKLYYMVLEDLRKHLHLSNFIDDHFGEREVDITYDDVFTNKIPKSDHYMKDLVNEIHFDESYIIVLLNSILTMKRLPDTLDFLKENCQPELETMSRQLSEFMHNIIQKSIDVPVLDLPIQKQHVFLIDLIENAICIFQRISNNYKSFLGILQNTLEVSGIADFQLHMDDFYSKLQTSVENFVSYYLEISLSTKESFAFSNPQNMGDVGSYFSFQSALDDKNLNLFKFSDSCHGMTFLKYSKGSRTLANDTNTAEESEKSTKMVLICRPALRNIILVFNPLKCFASEIEKHLDHSSSDQSPLHAFLYDSANVFLDQVNSDISKMLKTASANLDAWNTSPVDDYSSFRVNSEKQVLSCSLILENIMKELQNLMTCLSDYSNHFLRLIYYVILDYKDMYHKAFKQMFEEEQNVLSVSWARDRDIRRLIKSFLNWRHLEDDQSIDIIESPEEIRLRNKEESELLIRNLRSEFETWEIITDASKLSNLALLQENLIWFSVELLKFIKNFNQSQSNLQISSESKNVVTENSITNAVSGLRKVIKEYEDFADMCLLALHLEVRARCFHYLLTFSLHEICVESSFSQEFDTAVKSLTSDLLQIEEVLFPILTPKEFKYVFEGLGEVVASLMILIVSNMNRINETVVLKIDRNIVIIQCCLANITMAREVSLEKARQFIDLLKSTHEEILDQIVEEGPIFNEQEYGSVFRLISSNREEASHGLDYYLDKLKMIFKRLTVNAKDINVVP